MKKETLIVTAGRNSSKQAGSVNPPIYSTSTILFPTSRDFHAADKGKNYYAEAEDATCSDPSYGIAGTPTVFALQDAVKTLEEGDDCVITYSGLAAIVHALRAFLSAGDHILITDNVYFKTRCFCDRELKRFGVETTYYDPRIGGDIESLIKENTKIIFMESPGSQTFEVQDVPAIVAVAKKHNIVTMLDNCWGSPLYYSPLSVGVDISLVALTKYISGHADVMMGAIVTKGDSITRKILQEVKVSGLSVSPYDCSLALRGLRSVGARLERHSRTTTKVVEYIKTVPQVAKLLYPADVDSPDYELWKSQFSGAASLFTVVLDKKYDFDTICDFIDSLELFGVGFSWGGYVSLVLDFDPSKVRTATTWTETGSCLRFYIGLEDADDLIADLQQAFAKLA